MTSPPPPNPYTPGDGDTTRPVTAGYGSYPTAPIPRSLGGGDGDTRQIPTAPHSPEYRWSEENGYQPVGVGDPARAYRPGSSPYDTRPANASYGASSTGAPYSAGPASPPYSAPPGYQVYGEPTGRGRPGMRTDGMAVAALIFGLVALVLCWVPFVNVIAILGGIVALVVGALAVRRTRSGATTGRGLAIAGAIMGVVALLASVLLYVVLGSFWNDVSLESTPPDEVSAPATPSSDASDPLPTPDPAESVPPPAVEQPPDPGAVLPLAQSAELGDYTVTVTAVNTNADEILSAGGTNPSPQYQYVLADVTVVYTGAEIGDPWLDLAHAVQGADGSLYDWYGCGALEPNSLMDVPTLATGGTASYSVCFDVPPERLPGASVVVKPVEYVDPTGTRAHWAVP